jgi:hypothetical protein
VEILFEKKKKNYEVKELRYDSYDRALEYLSSIPSTTPKRRKNKEAITPKTTTFIIKFKKHIVH